MFQELFMRSPIKLRGFGLRSLVQSIPAAFIGGVERSLSAFPGEGGVCRKLEHLLGDGVDGAQWWRHLMDSNSQTGREFKESWEFLQREARQCSDFLGKEPSGIVEVGPDAAADLVEGASSRQGITEQREELREAVMREALLRYHDQQQGRQSHILSWTSFPRLGSWVSQVRRQGLLQLSSRR